jgi:hypothetical protein
MDSTFSAREKVEKIPHSEHSIVAAVGTSVFSKK